MNNRELKIMSPQIFSNKKILISSGATLEKIDEARAITNLSSGLMGFNLAKMAYTMGAEVTVISGHSNYEFPPCIKTVKAINHDEMSHSILLILKKMIFTLALPRYLTINQATQKAR